MRTIILLVSLLSVLAWGQQGPRVDLGSNGSYGALNVTADTTLVLPADGVLQVTTMSVAAGATLRFTPNARNTGVTIVAQGDVVIAGNIDVSGSTGSGQTPGVGGPGGGGGAPPALYGSGALPMMFGLYPYSPGRVGGTGGYGPTANTSNCTALGAGGAGGGGAIFIRSNSRISSSAGAQVLANAGVPSTVRPTCPTGATFNPPSGGYDVRVHGVGSSEGAERLLSAA